MAPPNIKEHCQKYALAISAARKAGHDSFQNWFDTSGTATDASRQGQQDFNANIFTPEIRCLIKDPRQATALEIGYGGGRLLGAAAAVFRDVVGIDVHDEAPAVTDYLRGQHCDNFTLIKGNGKNIPVSDNSVDFVFSFIVLQHLPDFDSLKAYLQEAYRCLKNGGAAQLYFGRYSILRLLERPQYLTRGYIELDRPVNITSLVVSKWKAKQLCRQAGFRIVGSGQSHKIVAGRRLKGNQIFLTLYKP